MSSSSEYAERSGAGAPSLYEEIRGTDDGGATSILAGLEASKKQDARKRWTIVCLFVSCAVGGLAATWYQVHRSPEVTPLAVTTNGAALPVSAQVPALPAPQILPAVAASQSAPPVSETKVESKPPAADHDAGKAEGPAGPADTAEIQIRSNAAPSAPASKKNGKSEQQAGKPKNTVAPKRGQGHLPAKKPNPQHVRATGRDNDIDLIAALLNHVSRREAAAVAPPPGRDIVMSAQGEPIGALVKRCQQIGGLEGVLCRWRICDGHWGRDAACPIAQHRID
jgi:hypothetical protein